MRHHRIYLNAFEMNCVGHQSPGLWTHPDDEAHRYTDIDYWADLACTLERGRFDAVFLADVLGIYDVYQGTRDAAVRDAVQVPVNDPMFVVPVMAQVTKHLGFGVTASVSYEHPYIFARRMSTLDHLTKGRVGWNIVTSYLDSAARNIGLSRQVSHDERYEIAEEFLEVCYKLWEASWEDGAVVRDKDRRTYTDPSKVHDIQHRGTYYTVPGAHLCEPSLQRTPVLFQAGASARGRAFAARHAECVFISSPTIPATRAYVDGLRKEAAKIGRDPNEIRVFSLFTPIVGRTQAEAEQKSLDYARHVSYDGALALYGGWSGVDFSKYAADENLRYVQNDAIHSATEVFTKMDPNRSWTVEQVAKFAGIGGRGPVVVGTPGVIADTMEKWVNEADVDGFNIGYAVTPGTFVDFVDLVVPELQHRGLVWTEYASDTLRGNLFGGSSRLQPHHPGRQYHLHDDATRLHEAT
ncbi:LLM class flavin-dependent oxidoreductase [Alicyclobacillus fastidiosus]|uniref:LLM class flavin-dependent oxidoreductase n=1 Tax=Alicyclobacillus fastidiosus TaxID=392011 RepID=A0ABY6ZPZ6_9BACL|nr:LLM class flavin-dependent oxidoreductase [Alicyclobacillus fastidiosus]WAH44171.1 LLM class flavin-dependent oxidoreductase [Alicyclobacillus fastidiosus]GMA60484.1 N5,N10-methylene tetrahydromethanopterin reductase [Alicyclobacillus fastidiosus]